MKKYILSLLSIALLQSCDSFLDVNPKGQLSEDVQFSDVQGFKDAMVGVYASLTQEALYGKELTFGLLGKLEQSSQNNTSYSYAQNYDYMSQNVRPTIDNIWSGAYASIAAINNILVHLENTNLKDSDLQTLKAEALALRAFLHFDIARLFAPDYSRSTDVQVKGIPYSYSFNLKDKKVYSLKESYENILKDLSQAETLLQNATYNPNLATDNYPASGANFTYYFNLYAVKALKARVFFTMGDYNQAAQYAQQVIQKKDIFHLSTSENFSKVKAFPANGEMIFGIQISNSDIPKSYANIYLRGDSEFYSTARRDLETLYNTASFSASNTDVRYAAYYKKSTTTQFIRFLSSDDENLYRDFRGIPLISLSEMYYIACESLFDTNVNQAKDLLNEVRKSRGLEPLSTLQDKEEFVKQMRDERMREMPAVGQIFFALKHYNISFTKANGESVTPSEEIFNLPWPEKEIEFGQPYLQN